MLMCRDTRLLRRCQGASRRLCAAVGGLAALCISGGAGRFAGIVGGGEVVVRGDFRKITVAPGAPVTEAVTGILYWPNLHYSLP